MHLTPDEAREKNCSNIQIRWFLFSQVENQVMGKFELEYIFIEGKAHT